VQTASLEEWLATLQHDFAEQILPVTSTIAEAWGRPDVPTPLPAIDGLLLATALVHGLPSSRARPRDCSGPACRPSTRG
jgi:predicted nucleic acid-binding protein